MNVPDQRLRFQHITRPHEGPPEGLIAWLGAVQAQEYPFAKWALALRLGASATDADIERAFTEGRILRTHVMRPTWHFVAAPDIGWMLALTAPRVHGTLASYVKHQGIDRRTLVRATAVIERALDGGRSLTRRELGTALARSHITLSALQLGLVTLFAELERVICSGPRINGQFTYALLPERAGRQRELSPDEALAELTTRFFRSHGPATVRDFVWWSGLRTSAARRGLDIVKARSCEQDGLTYWSVATRSTPVRADLVHLLPIYDEYLVAYRDRVAVPHGPGTIKTGSRVVGFRHAMVIDGQVAGTWRTETNGRAAMIQVTPMRRLRTAERKGIAAAVDRYARFLGTEVSLMLG